MDLGDHGSYYVTGSSRHLLSLPFSWIHAASQPLNMLRTNLPHAHLQPVTAVSSQPLQAKNMPLR